MKIWAKNIAAEKQKCTEALKGAVTEETNDNSDVKNKNVFMVCVVI